MAEEYTPQKSTDHCLLSLFRQTTTLIFLPSYLFYQNKEIKGKAKVTAAYVGLLMTIGCLMPVGIAKFSDKEFLELLHHACEKMHLVDESQQVINAFSDYPDVLGGQEVATSLALVAFCSVIYNILTSLLLLPKLCGDKSKDIDDPSSEIGIDPDEFFNPGNRTYGYVRTSDSPSRNKGIVDSLKHFLFARKRAGEESTPTSKNESGGCHGYSGLMEGNQNGHDPIDRYSPH